MKLPSKVVPLVVGLCAMAVTSVGADQRGRAPRGRAIANAQGQVPRTGDLKPGDLAPDFTLEPIGDGPAVSLASFRNRQPVALVFGSYT